MAKRPPPGFDGDAPESQTNVVPFPVDSRWNARVNRLLATVDDMVSMAQKVGIPVGWEARFEKLRAAREDVP